MYIDFQELKAHVSIVDVAALLNLDLTERNDQLRGPCPRCKEGGDRALVVTPVKQVYYCFAAEQGGDCIALAAHIRNSSMRDAAIFIHKGLRRGVDDEHAGDDADHVADDTKSAAKEATDHALLRPLSYLIYEHEAVQALGIDPEIAKALGIGYAKKGIMRGRVAIPLRTPAGILAGYCGYAADLDPVLKLPKNFRIGE
jgi:DNA primase